jgi:hypothetical protein
MSRKQVTMADLTAGTRIHHIGWDETGTVRVTEGLVSVKFDGSFVDTEISDEGVIFPEDLEIVQGSGSGA